MREQHGSIKEQHGPGFERVHPRRFGNYDLERRIDVGGMGEVYLARQRTAFDREVAIKIIRSDLVHDMTARRRFLREAEVNAHIKHEHILPLYEFGEEQGRLFLVTPYIAGGTLARRLHKGPMTLSEVHQLFTALVRAVAYIHRRGVIHRDLKPSNILLDQEENSDQVYVRLIDFGIATIQGMAASPPLTEAGTEMGTLAYMAPERMSGIAAPSNDIFSLGIILHQMLTGRMPDEEPKATLAEPLAYVVKYSITPQLEERFATAEELLDAFEEAYQSLMVPEEEVVPVVQRTGASRVHTVSRRRVESTEEEEDAGRGYRTRSNIKSEARAVSQVDSLTSAPQKPSTFIETDYGAPTVNLDVYTFEVEDSIDVEAVPTAPPLVPVKSPPPKRKKKRRNPLVAIITILIVLILFVMAGLLYFGLQTVIAPTATINIAPKVQTVREVYHITAEPGLKNSNIATASIPANLLNESKNASLSGGTTGQSCPIPGIPIGCEPAVQQSDVDTLDAQLQKTLRTQITAVLQEQLQKSQGTTIGIIQFIDGAGTANPAVGTPGKTVTVSMTEVGKLSYYRIADAQNIARQLLEQQIQKLGPNVSLLNSTLAIGEPVITNVSSAGVVLSVAIGGDVQYRITPALLHDIANAIKGLQEQDALAYLKHRPEIDPASVTIHLSAGKMMPGNSQQITIIPINPTTIPLFNLPVVTPVHIPTATPTQQVAPGSTPTGTQ